MIKDGTIISQADGAKAEIRIRDNQTWVKWGVSAVDLGDTDGQWHYSSTYNNLSFLDPNGKDLLFVFVKVPADFLITHHGLAGEGAIMARGRNAVREDIFWKIRPYLSAATDSGDADEDQSNAGDGDQNGESDSGNDEDDKS
jgi:hypothetical protein